MVPIKILSISAALAVTGGSFVLFAAPAAAQSRQLVVTAPSEDVLPKREVKYADLNLTAKTHQATLARRVRAAVRDVCEESYGRMPPHHRDQECRATAWNGAEPQIDRAIQRARDIAMTGESSIAAAAITISVN